MHRPFARLPVTGRLDLILLTAALLTGACGSSGDASPAPTEIPATSQPAGASEDPDTTATPETGGTSDSNNSQQEEDDQEPLPTLTPSATPSVVTQRFATLGGWDGTQWSSYGQPDFDGPASVGDKFTIIGINGNNSVTQVSAIGPICDPVGALGLITSPEIPSEWGGDSPIAVKADWDLQPHGPPTPGNPAPLYFDAVREFFADRGVEVGQIEITQWFKLDLEGDGVDEVVLSAKSKGLNPSQESISYPAVSVVLLRRVIDEEAKTWFLSHSIFTEADGANLGGEKPDIQTFRVSSFADLNGDGRVEIIINDQSFEGAGTTVWEYINDTVGPRAVLDGGCGS